MLPALDYDSAADREHAGSVSGWATARAAAPSLSAAARRLCGSVAPIRRHQSVLGDHDLLIAQPLFKNPPAPADPRTDRRSSREHTIAAPGSPETRGCAKLVLPGCFTPKVPRPPRDGYRENHERRMTPFRRRRSRFVRVQQKKNRFRLGITRIVEPDRRMLAAPPLDRALPARRLRIDLSDEQRRTLYEDIGD